MESYHLSVLEGNLCPGFSPKHCCCVQRQLGEYLERAVCPYKLLSGAGVGTDASFSVTGPRVRHCKTTMSHLCHTLSPPLTKSSATLGLDQSPYCYGLPLAEVESCMAPKGYNQPQVMLGRIEVQSARVT